MKRLTDERIAALIDIAPLSKTIVDIKTALTELQERRKADAKPVISIIIKDGWPEENTAAPIHGSPKLTDGIHELYAAPPVPDEMTVEAAYPEVQTGWNDAKNYAAGWNACRAAMLQSFGNSEQLSPPVIPEGWMMVPKTLTTGMREAALAVFGIGDIDIEWSHLLAAAPKPEMEKNMKEHKEYLTKEAALEKIISAAGKDPSEITDAVWAAGYRKPERTEAEAVNLTINIFAGFKYSGIPEDAWPKTYDEILQCELNEILNEELWRDIPPDVIANRLIGEGYRKEEP